MSFFSKAGTVEQSSAKFSTQTHYRLVESRFKKTHTKHPIFHLTHTANYIIIPIAKEPILHGVAKFAAINYKNIPMQKVYGTVSCIFKLMIIKIGSTLQIVKESILRVS